MPPPRTCAPWPAHTPPADDLLAPSCSSRRLTPLLLHAMALCNSQTKARDHFSFSVNILLQGWRKCGVW
jgi:hypothetical protein